MEKRIPLVRSILKALFAVVLSSASRPSCKPCNSPLGLEGGLIDNSQIIGLNSYNNNHELYGAHLARLNAPRGYRANIESPSLAWITIDFERDVVVSEISTQGYGDSQVSEWVTEFKIYYAFHEGDLQPLKDSFGNEKIFLANKDRNSVRMNKIPVPFIATRMMFVPVKWNNNVGLRMEVYGCKPGYSFNVWLMVAKTPFSLSYFYNDSEVYNNKADQMMSEVVAQMESTYGFLYAKLIRFSPQSQPLTMQTNVVAEIKIYTLPQKEELLAGKLDIIHKSVPDLIDPAFFELQYTDKCDCPPPDVTLNSLSRDVTNAHVVYRNHGKPFFGVTSKFPGKCNTKIKLVTWEITYITKTVKRFSPIVKKEEVTKSNTSRHSIVVILLKEAELVYVRCKVQMIHSQGAVGYDYGFFKIVDPDLVAKITGKSTVSRDEQIVLDASKSYDPVIKRLRYRGLRFTWKCQKIMLKKSVSNAIRTLDCNRILPVNRRRNLRILKIDSSLFEEGTYTFTLTVFKTNRRKSAQFNVTILPPAVVKISCPFCSRRISTNESIKFDVSCDGNDCHGNKVYRWNTYRETLLNNWEKVTQLTTVTLNNGEQFHIETPAELLPQNNTWSHRFKVEVELGDSKDFAFFEINRKPYTRGNNSGCFITPSSGIGVSTEFTLKCTGWFDADLPLTYQFIYYEEFGTVIFHSGHESSKKTTLPPGREEDGFQLKLEANVIDRLGSQAKLTLVAKVIPSYDLSTFQKRLKNFTDSASTSVKKGLIDTTAENALSLIQTAPKVLPKESDQVKLKDMILSSIQEMHMQSITQVTKVVAIVALATNRSKNLQHRVRKESLNLLQKSLHTMNELQEAEDFGDLKVAKNITTTLMLGIEKVIISSIVERDAYSRNDTKDALQVVDRVAETLISLKRVGEPPSVIKSSSIDIVVYRAKPDDIAGKKISEGNGGVELPSMDVLFGNSSQLPFVDFQMIQHANNPYSWNEPIASSSSSSSCPVFSGVLDITLKNNGKKMEIANLSKPISLSLSLDSGQQQQRSSNPITNSFIKPSNGTSNFRYHPFIINNELHSIHFKLVPEDGKTMEIFIQVRRRPTASDYVYTQKIPDTSSCNTLNSSKKCSKFDFTITSEITGVTGLHYLGLRYIKDIDTPLHVRKRRDCVSHNGRQKRSCVEVKDPPTTPPPTSVTVVPTYNSSTDVNYTLRSEVSFCGYWKEEEERWSSEGCKFGNKESSKQFSCLCNHLSAFGGDFFVAPNPIDFDKVFMEFGRLGETGNYVVLSTVCILWAAYLLGLIIARKADKKDKDKIVIQVMPSVQENSRCYKISIETGMWYGNGTTADVIVDLYGAEGSSGPLYLNDPNSEKLFFSRSSINIFYVSLPNSLGNLNRIKVKHNNAGTDPSWYLKDVFVVDIASGSKFHFVADRWIAVHKGDGKLECTFTETKEKNSIPFKSAFRSRMSKKLGESHLWISLFSRPPQNSFTRCQRLSCCVSVLFAAMVTSAMFYRFGIESKNTIYIGGFKISWTEIKIGVQSALLAFPVNILIVMMFRNIKQPRIESDTEIEQNLKTSGYLPSFFIYISWILCVGVAIVSSTFVVFYSLTWGASTSNGWLKSIMISFFQDSLIIQPIKIIGIAFMLSMIFRKADDHETTSESPTVTSTALSSQRYFVPSHDEIEKSRVFKSNVARLSMTLIEMALFFVFVVLLTAVVYGNRGPARFDLTSHLKETFQQFEMIKSQSMYWTWTRRNLLPAVYNVTWYNKKTFQGPEGFIGSKSVFLVGMPRIRQIRVKPDHNCAHLTSMVQMIYSQRCFYYSAKNEETSKYNWMDWTPILNGTFFYSEFQMNNICPKPWRYKTAMELKTLPIKGKYKYYYGGGYVADLGYNLKTAEKVLEKIEKNNWIDSLTTAVLTEFTVFEPASQLFSIVKLLYERLPTGGLNLLPSFETIPIYFRRSGSSSIADTLQPIFMLVVLLLFILEIVRLFLQKCSYLKDFWNWLTLCQCFGSVAIVVIFFCKQKHASDYVQNVHENPYKTASCDHLILWTDVELYTISFVIFVTTIKCLRLFRFVPQICQMTGTLRASAKFLFSHIGSFAVVILAFTELASTAFGSTIPSYATFIGTIGTLLQQLIGGRFHFTTVRSADPVLGPLFLFSYVFLSTFILVNMFIAILCEFYANIRADHSTKKYEDVELGEFLLTVLRSMSRESLAKLWRYFKSLTWGRTGKYNFNYKPTKFNPFSISSKLRTFSGNAPRISIFKSQKGSYDFNIINQGDGYCYQVIPQEVIFTQPKTITGMSYKPLIMSDALPKGIKIKIPKLKCDEHHYSHINGGPMLATFDSDSSLDSTGSIGDLDFEPEDHMKNVENIDFVKRSLLDIRDDLISMSTITLTTNNDSYCGNGSLEDIIDQAC